MKWILIVLAIVVLAVLIMYLIGYFMPVKHVASVECMLKQRSPAEVWKVITSFNDYPEWRKDVKKVEQMDDRNWRETSGHSDIIHYFAEEMETEKKLVTRIMSKDLPFGGAWTYELKPAHDGTVLTITENGEVYNPLFRFMSRYLFGHDSTLKAYVKNLELKLNKK